MEQSKRKLNLTRGENEIPRKWATLENIQHPILQTKLDPNANELGYNLFSHACRHLRIFDYGSRNLSRNCHLSANQKHSVPHTDRIEFRLYWRFHKSFCEVREEQPAGRILNVGQTGLIIPYVALLRKYVINFLDWGRNERCLE